MGSMNNWLAFSLSPQELPPPQPHPSPSAVSRLISADDCFGLSADSASAPPLGIPTLRPDGSFGILEAIHRTSHQPQDWSMKSSVDFKGGSSELSMLVGSSSNRNNMDNEQPKLEDFLGGHSFSDSEQKLYDTGSGYLFNDCSLQLPVVQSENGAAHNNSSIGISMIKSWLRNQPAPQQQLDGIANGSGATAGGLGSSQSLSLSMSTGSQSSSSLPLLAAGGNGVGECSSSDGKPKGSGSGLDAQSGAIEAVPRKSIDTFGQRTSIYRGVTRHRWTGRYEAHLWDNSCRREGQTRKGRQVYLGGYDKEDKAARAYDLAALKYWGPTTTTNFPITNYEKELEEMKHMTRQEYVASLRRKSSGFSRGASIYRGVTRHHQHGRWQARIGRVAGNKDLYLGTFSTQEEAAEAYDIAAIKFRGLNAVTNFEMSRYDVKSILESSTLPIGGAAKRLKESSDQDPRIDGNHNNIITSQLTDGMGVYAAHYHPGWPAVAFPQPQAMGVYNTYGHNKGWCKQEQQDAIVAAHSLQDLHHLHLSSNTHNFFQQPSVPHSLMSLDSSSMEHSTGSNSVNYQGFVMPNGGSGGYGGGEGNMMLSSDSYATRNNSYFISPQSAVSVAKTSGYEQSSTCTNAWMPASVQAVAARASEVGVCNGAAPLFPVWNDG